VPAVELGTERGSNEEEDRAHTDVELLLGEVVVRLAGNVVSR